jgi:PAS domain S-box-containing protein
MRVFLLLVSCWLMQQASAADDTIRLQLKWWHQFQFAGYYAAQVKGFYSAEGLKVKLVPGDIEHDPIREVLSGRAQFGISGSDLLLSYAKGQPVIALGALFQHSPYILISLASKGIRVPSDLVGKSLMASETQGWIELQAVFLKEGIPIDSLHVVRHSWKNEDLISGKVDAITGYYSVELNQLRKQGVEPAYIQPVNYGIDFYGDLLFSLQSMTGNNPEKTKRFIRASFKGWEYAMEHPGEIADYILTLPGVKDRGVTKADLLTEAEAMQKLIEPDLIELGHMNEGRWNHILDIYKSLHLVSPRTQIDGFLYDEHKDFSSKFIRAAVVISVAVLVVLLIIILYSISLRASVSKRTMQLEKEIEQRKLTQEQLRVSEERLEMATDAAEIGIWDWDIVRNTLYLNDMWKIMLGYEPSELKNEMETFNRLLHPDENEKVWKQVEDHLAGLSSYQAMMRMKTKDNKWKWILSISKTTLRNEKGEAIRVSGVYIDMDDIKEKELELKELTEELMISNKELQQFAYITSHNLRAPVANLRSLTWLFDKEGISEKNKSLFEKITLSIDKLSITLDDLNEILSSRVHKTEGNEKVLFAKELTDVMQSISEEIREMDAGISYDFSKAGDICYPRKVIHSVLLNMLTNAIKYRKEKEKPLIHISTEEDKDFVILTIRDNGKGIDMNKYGNKIFGLYQRFHENTEGKGLGLYIVKSQVEALGGKIAVESMVNKGTEFQVFLKKMSMPYDT